MKRFTLLLCLALICLTYSTPVSAAEHSPTLDQIISSSPEGAKIPVILYLDSRLMMDDVYPTAKTLPMSERRTYVVDALKKRFAEMSGALMPRLEQEKKAGNISILRPLWILNAVRMHGTAEVIAAIDKEFPEVYYISYDPNFKNTLDTGWGVAEIQAPRVWTQLGADGSGVVVAHKDAGLNIHHPGFQGHLWINPGEDLNDNGVEDPSDDNGIDDDGNGYVDDFYGWGFDSDDNDVTDSPSGGGHGTKTGSVISCNPNFSLCDTVCVAPGAKLMELSAFLSQGAVFEASQYAIAMGAQVMSASLSFKYTDCNDPQVLACPDFVAHRMVSEMELAAGMIHANSTGNQGSGTPVPYPPAPSNCPPPAMTPSHLQQGGLSSIVSVSGYNSDGSYYSSSGRGPAAWSRQDICSSLRMPFCAADSFPNHYPSSYNDYPYQGGTHPGLAKPDVTAPTTVSCLDLGGGCSSINGTSGATPHVGGVLALIFSAFPGITPEQAYLLLVNTAQDAGNPGFDSLWGFGKIRPFPACSTGAATMPHVFGIVSTSGGQPITGARVSTRGADPSFSDASGHYEMWLEAGTDTLLFEKYGYSDVSEIVTLSGNQSVTRNVTMPDAQNGSLAGTVNGNGPDGTQPLANFMVRIPEIQMVATTDAAGHYSFDNIFSGDYDVVSGSWLWTEQRTPFHVVSGTNTLNFTLPATERIQPSGPDHHGYMIYENTDHFGPAFHWEEINPNLGGLQGTRLNILNDTSAVQLLPFSFRFYGQDYTSITVADNGYIIMGTSASTDFGQMPIPSTQFPNGYIAVYYTDWQPPLGGTIYGYDDAENHRYIVEWYHQIEYYQNLRATFECILYDPQFYPTPTNDGVIEVQFQSFTGRADGSVGLENQAGTDGLQFILNDVLDAHAIPIEAGRLIQMTTLLADAADPQPIVTPSEYTLEQNYPNPFNPTTTFVWNAPRANRIRLTLVNILGQEAAVIYDGFASVGRNEVTYDASKLGSGIYFAKLEAEGMNVALRKVMLLK